MIVGTARELAYVFRNERVFRVGGDEFLVLLSDYGRDEVEANMEFVKKSLKESGIFVSLGLAWEKNYKEDFQVMKEIADKKMYEDKNQFYESTGHPRRI